MSFVNATPEYVASAASDLAKIGSSISYANSTASTVTSAVEAAGADAVSTSISQLFGAHAAAYQAISSQAALFHQQFVQLMSGGATEYADTEAVNAAPLQAGAQAVLGGAGASGPALSAQPLIGSAAQAGSLASGVPVAAAVQPAAAAPAAVAATAAAPATATVTPMAATTAVAAAPAGSAASATAGASTQPQTPGSGPVAIPVSAPDAPGPLSASVAPVNAETAELSSAPPMLPAAMPAAQRSGPAIPPPPAASPKGRPPTPAR
jgi:PE family